MKKPYLIYCNKTHGVWAMDAYKWVKDNGHNIGDYREIMSEAAFNVYLEENMLNNHPVIFLTEILTKRK